MMNIHSVINKHLRHVCVPMEAKISALIRKICGRIAGVLNVAPVARAIHRTVHNGKMIHQSNITQVTQPLPILFTKLITAPQHSLLGNRVEGG